MDSFSLAIHKPFLLLLIIFFMLLSIACSRRVVMSANQNNLQEELGMEVYPSGSSLPDCSHACGGCFPCKRVMVSFKCSMAESCPIVYRCICKGKYYHVPSN